MTKDPKGMSALAQQGVMLPQESVLEVARVHKELFIGIPKEISYEENRIPLVPESVGLLVSHGHRVLIETGAGVSANFTDSDYSEAGAQIAYSNKEVYKADVVLKVAPPSLEEVEMMQHRQSLFSILQIGMQQPGYVQQLSSKKITALAFEYLRDETDVYPVIQAMSEIVGSTVILIASELLSNTTGGKGELLGGVPGIPPTKVVILGAGTVGEYAARAALGLGANVKIFDNNIYKLRRVQRNLGTRVYTSTLNPAELLKVLKTCDVAIGALSGSAGRTPVVVTEEMVKSMKFGSVILDMAVEQGGNVVGSKLNETLNVNGVTIIGEGNIPSLLPMNASDLYAKNIQTLLYHLASKDGFKWEMEEEITKGSLIVLSGKKQIK